MDLVIFLSVAAASLQLTAILTYYFGVARKIEFNSIPLILTAAMSMLFIQQLFGVWLFTRFDYSESIYLKYIHMFVLPTIIAITFLWMGIKKIKYMAESVTKVKEILDEAHNDNLLPKRR